MPAGPLNEDDLDKEEFKRLKTKIRVNSASMESGEKLRNFMQRYEAKEKELKKKYGSQYAKESIKFTLNRAEQMVVNEWLEELKPEIMAKQGKSFETISPNEPYYGAMGGGLTYSFLPTGLGNIVTVKESITGKELNVSEALDWFFFG